MIDRGDCPCAATHMSRSLGSVGGSVRWRSFSILCPSGGDGSYLDGGGDLQLTGTPVSMVSPYCRNAYCSCSIMLSDTNYRHWADHPSSLALLMYIFLPRVDGVCGRGLIWRNFWL